jgi:ribosomal protein S18 acetylase RimI-like enzyme
MQSAVVVTTTYLELPSPEALRPVAADHPDAMLIEAHRPTAEFYRFLYAAVGRDLYWTSRNAWSDAQLQAYFDHPGVCVLVLYVGGVPSGYIELLRDAAEPGTEITQFGLMAHAQGRGLGKYLLWAGATRAFDDGAARVWLHTCTLDGPHALANYLARGFVPYKTTLHRQYIDMPQPASTTTIERWPADHPDWRQLQALIDTLDQADWVGFVAEWHLDNHMLVARQGNRVVGFLRFVIQVIGVEEDGDPVTLDGAELREAKVLAFGVAPDVRRQGVGRALQLTLIDEARARGLFQIRSHSSATSIANQRLKLALGYAIHPLHPAAGRTGAYFLLPLFGR